MHSQNSDCSSLQPSENSRGAPSGYQPLRLIVSPAEGNTRTKYGDKFDSYLGDNLIVTSSQPLYDGARALRDLGYPDDTLLTIRHHDRPYDSFKPVAIGKLAKWTVHCSDKKGISRQKWQAMPDSLKELRRESP